MTKLWRLCVGIGVSEKTLKEFPEAKPCSYLTQVFILAKDEEEATAKALEWWEKHERTYNINGRLFSFINSEIKEELKFDEVIEVFNRGDKGVFVI